MEAKKNPQADLEKRKGLLFQLGMVLALALVLVAFEWAQFEKTNSTLGKLSVDLEEEEMIPITQQTPPPPPPPPPPPQTIVLEIVEDDEEVDEEIDMDTEADEDTEVEIVEEEEEVIEESEIFTIVEDMPSFPGGEAKLMEYLGKNTKFPPLAKDAGIQGIVYVTFVIAKDGSIADVRVLRGIGGGCDEEAMRVIKNMPKWKPGKQRGRPVRVQYNIPIRFILRGG